MQIATPLSPLLFLPSFLLPFLSSFLYFFLPNSSWESMGYLQDWFYILGKTFVCIVGYVILKRTESHFYFSFSDSLLRPIFPTCSIMAAPSHIIQSSTFKCPRPSQTSAKGSQTLGQYIYYRQPVLDEQGLMPDTKSGLKREERGKGVEVAIKTFFIQQFLLSTSIRVFHYSSCGKNRWLLRPCIKKYEQMESHLRELDNLKFSSSLVWNIFWFFSYETSLPS